MAPNHARSADTPGVDQPDSVDDATFAYMLEQSSLGSPAAREARRTGAKIRDELGVRQAPWHKRTSACVDVAELHTQMAEFFDGQQDNEVTELWLRAALLRTLDAATATWLAATLERRRDLSQAYIWYLRAAQQGDMIAAGRLAVTAHLGGNRDLADLLLSLGSASLATSRRAAANELMAHLSRARSRRRAGLLTETADTDLMYWVGCVLFCFGDHAATARECFSAAVARGHRVATPTLYDVTAAANPSGDGLASVRSIADRIGRAVHAEPPGPVVSLVSEPTGSTSRDVPDEWITAAIAGDRAAVERVLGVIRPLVLQYCRARLAGVESSRVAIDDIAQETCLAVLTALPGYRVQGRPFMAFVYGIASHKVIDARRAAGRNRSDAYAATPDRIDASGGPEERALQVELSEQMARLLDILPEKHREIIALRVVVGLSADETAAAVGSTPAAVRVAQHRALTRLRRSMSEEELL